MTPKEAASRVNEWANWRIRLESSALGYPSSTVESRINSGSKRPPGPIVPNVAMNPRAAAVDRAIANMPQELATLIWLRHVEAGKEADKIKAWCQVNTCSRSKWYAESDRAYGFIAGWLTARA